MKVVFLEGENKMWELLLDCFRSINKVAKSHFSSHICLAKAFNGLEQKNKQTFNKKPFLIRIKDSFVLKSHKYIIYYDLINIISGQIVAVLFY